MRGYFLIIGRRIDPPIKPAGGRCGALAGNLRTFKRLNPPYWGVWGIIRKQYLDESLPIMGGGGKVAGVGRGMRPGYDDAAGVELVQPAGRFAG